MLFIKNKLVIALILISSMVSAQMKPKVRLRPMFILERSKPIEFKRSSEYNYKIDKGVGAELSFEFSKQISEKPMHIGFGPALNQILCWTKKGKTNEYADSYRERHTISAGCFNAGLSVGTLSVFPETKAFVYYFNIKAGMAYTQNTFVFDSSTRPVPMINSPSWKSLIGIHIGFIYLNPKIWIPIAFGFQYTNLGGKHLNGFMLN